MLWDELGRTSEVYMIANDDVRFETHGWDNILRDEVAKYPDGVVLACPYDPVAPAISTFPIFGWGWLNALGRVYAGYFHYWFDDMWVDQVGRMIGRYINIPMLLSPIRGKGKTQRMRCLPFWTRFFQLMLRERKEAATKLITAMYPKDEKARAEALAKMEEIADSFKKEEAKLLRCLSRVPGRTAHGNVAGRTRTVQPAVFQAGSARGVPPALYAQEHFAKKEYAEALKYIEATQLADIRARPAQDMKVECLRALGRHAEAEQTAREAVLAWPKMNTARRLFRFFGKVANEAKGLLVGIIWKGKRDPNKKLQG